MSTIADEITHWKNLQTALQNASALRKSALNLSSKASHLRVLDNGQNQFHAMQEVLVASGVLENSPLKKLIDEEIEILSQRLQEEQEAEQFETQARRLLQMATSYKLGPKRKFEYGLVDKGMTSVEDVKEQLDVMVTTSKKLKRDDGSNQLVRGQNSDAVGVVDQGNWQSWSAYPPRSPE